MPSEVLGYMECKVPGMVTFTPLCWDDDLFISLRYTSHLSRYIGGAHLMCYVIHDCLLDVRLRVEDLVLRKKLDALLEDQKQLDLEIYYYRRNGGNRDAPPSQNKTHRERARELERGPPRKVVGTVQGRRWAEKFGKLLVGMKELAAEPEVQRVARRWEDEVRAFGANHSRNLSTCLSLQPPWRAKEWKA